MKFNRQLLIAPALISTVTAAGTRAAASSSSSQELTAEEVQRARLKHKEVTLHAWNSHQSEVRPLDLRLDENDPTQVYQTGSGGWLEPYDDENYQEEYEVVVNIGDDSNIEPPVSPIGESESVKPEDYSSVARNLVSRPSVFKYTDETDPLKLEQDDASSYLQKKKKGGGKKDSSSNGKKKGGGKKEGSSNSKDKNKGGGKIGSSTNEEKKGGGKGGGKKGGRKKKSSSNSSNNSENDAPLINSVFPAKNTKVGENEAFGALVKDAGSGVESVCVQLKDHLNKMSDCYEAVHVGKDIWEITFDGFGDYGGETWAYRVQSEDKSNNKETTEWTSFIIDGGSASNKSSSGSGGGGGSSRSNSDTSNSGQTSGSGKKLTANENDDSWPYGGEYMSIMLPQRTQHLITTTLLINLASFHLQG
jgi:hypothetical protein